MVESGLLDWDEEIATEEVLGADTWQMDLLNNYVAELEAREDEETGPSPEQADEWIEELESTRVVKTEADIREWMDHFQFFFAEKQPSCMEKFMQLKTAFIDCTNRDKVKQTTILDFFKTV